MFDPDFGLFEDLIDEIEEAEACEQEMDVNIDPDADMEEFDAEGSAEEVETNFVEDAIIAGAIFGMGVEEGEAEKKRPKIQKEKLFRHRHKKQQKDERSPGAVSLREMDKKKGEKKLRPFEQWIEDICHGRKTIEDEM